MNYLILEWQKIDFMSERWQLVVFFNRWGHFYLVWFGKGSELKRLHAWEQSNKYTFTFQTIQAVFQVRQRYRALQKSVKTRKVFFFPAVRSLTVSSCSPARCTFTHSAQQCMHLKQHGQGGHAGPLHLLRQNWKPGHGEAAGHVWTWGQLSAERQWDVGGSLLSVCEVSWVWRVECLRPCGALCT